MILRYLERVSGYSRQTVTRLVAQSVDQGQVRRPEVFKVVVASVVNAKRLV